MSRGNFSCLTQLVDNAGNSIRRAYVVGVPCVYDGTKKHNYTILDPGSRTTVVFTYTSTSGTVTGNIFSFSANMLKLEGAEWSRFSVGIPNIELQ